MPPAGIRNKSPQIFYRFISIPAEYGNDANSELVSLKLKEPARFIISHYEKCKNNKNASKSRKDTC